MWQENKLDTNTNQYNKSVNGTVEILIGMNFNKSFRILAFKPPPIGIFLKIHFIIT